MIAALKTYPASLGYKSHTSGHCATGSVMFKRKEWTDDKCPRCGADNETISHVWRCPEPSAQDVWAAALLRLKTHLETNQTAPALIQDIIHGLTAWGKAEPGAQTDGPSVAQNLLGWQAMLEGLISVEWREAQAKYLEATKSRRSPARWTASLIVKLWEVAWDMWEHRNGILHNKEMGRRRQILRQEIAHEFTRGYRTLPLEVKRLFQKGEHYWLQANLEIQEAWIMRIKVARIAVETSSGTFQAGRTFMARWLRK